ncbi:hypothetical protein KOI35_09690 [Actinoplanes bogorensis]|uniref:PurM-like N-terminal domain-containing protein n=1 Tax=Paractinoplanes bogorensis TaxID=1610840 RepID=A0ABS5YJW9_9ACTN|nr:AIR synthase related protein [Actinoplanes bogorensis]MBU2663779.1 hypothetical protein [Actinoplanes bogorensis]
MSGGLEALARGERTIGDVVGRVRDLTIVDNGSTTIVIACDSNASIGVKPMDALQQDPQETGYSAAKVPLMEVLATGATPFLLVDNLCCELEPYGKELLIGVQAAADRTGLPIAITGSDETNMPTVQTGIGVTVMGVVVRAGLRCGSARDGDLVFAVGLPRDGREVPFVDGTAGIASPADIIVARDSPYASEVLPVGSRGIAYEAGELARVAGLTFASSDSDVSLTRSAGPSTCFLVAASAEFGPWMASRTECAVAVVGRLSLRGPAGGALPPGKDPS